MVSFELRLLPWLANPWIDGYLSILGKKYVYLYMSTYNNYLIFKEGILEEGRELDHWVSHYFTFMVESHLIKCNEYLFQRAKTFG